jgi:hypothetical protein
MTDDARTELEKEVLYEQFKAQQAHDANCVRVEQIADKLQELVDVHREEPEHVTRTPGLDKPDYRELLKVVDQEALLVACREYGESVRRLQAPDRKAASLRIGTTQTKIDI